MSDLSNTSGSLKVGSAMAPSAGANGPVLLLEGLQTDSALLWAGGRTTTCDFDKATVSFLSNMLFVDANTDVLTVKQHRRLKHNHMFPIFHDNLWNWSCRRLQYHRHPSHVIPCNPGPM